MWKEKIPVKSHTSTHVKKNHEYLIHEMNLHLYLESDTPSTHPIIPEKPLRWITGYCWLAHQKTLDSEPQIDGWHYRIASTTPAQYPAPTPPTPIKKTELIHSIQAFQTASFFYKDTSVTHSAALLDPRGDLIATGQDLCVEHALYKAVGHWLDTDAPAVGMLMISGTITEAIIHDAHHLGAYWIVSRLAPTHAAYTQAQALGIGLIGFARVNRFSVFCSPPIQNAIITP
jgi:hypothetical protein